MPNDACLTNGSASLHDQDLPKRRLEHGSQLPVGGGLYPSLKYGFHSVYLPLPGSLLHDTVFALELGERRHRGKLDFKDIQQRDRLSANARLWMTDESVRWKDQGGRMADAGQRPAAGGETKVVRQAVLALLHAS